MIIVALILSTNCFSQIKIESLVGKWRFENTTDYNDSIVKSSVKQFDFIIHENGNFDMPSKEYSISGTWELTNSTLTLIGKRSDKEETKTEKMKIYSVNEQKLSFILITENQKESLMNLKRIK
ncbi:hypothetical protein [Tenacibaculum geojense]|uniref:Lipocalin-like domain-containing protein n=1 Tax=Tenacibaculum geojense TaxID=915352 RepID=A0ABW3JNY1_9FLAO